MTTTCAACKTMTAEEIAEAGYSCDQCGLEFPHDDGVHTVQYATYHEFICNACHAAVTNA